MKLAYEMLTAVFHLHTSTSTREAHLLLPFQQLTFQVPRQDHICTGNISASPQPYNPSTDTGRMSCSVQHSQVAKATPANNRAATVAQLVLLAWLKAVVKELSRGKIWKLFLGSFSRSMRYNPFCHKHHLQNPQTILDTGPLICHSIQQRLKRSAAWFGYISFSIGTWTTVSWNDFPEEKKMPFILPHHLQTDF